MAIVTAHGRRAQIHRGHPPLDAAQFDDVADADLAFEEQDESADEILDDGLGTEADADGQCAAGEGEDRQRNARQVEDEHDQGDAENDHRPAPQHRSDLRAQLEAGDELALHEPGESGQQPVAEYEDDDDAEALANRDAVLDRDPAAIHFRDVLGDEQFLLPNPRRQSSGSVGDPGQAAFDLAITGCRKIVEPAGDLPFQAPGRQLGAFVHGRLLQQQVEEFGLAAWFAAICRQVVDADALGTDFGSQGVLSGARQAAPVGQFLAQFGQGVDGGAALFRIGAAQQQVAPVPGVTRDAVDHLQVVEPLEDGIVGLDGQIQKGRLSAGGVACAGQLVALSAMPGSAPADAFDFFAEPVFFPAQALALCAEVFLGELLLGQDACHDSLHVLDTAAQGGDLSGQALLVESRHGDFDFGDPLQDTGDIPFALGLFFLCRGLGAKGRRASSAGDGGPGLELGVEVLQFGLVGPVAGLGCCQLFLEAVDFVTQSVHLDGRVGRRPLQTLDQRVRVGRRFRHGRERCQFLQTLDLFLL